MPKKLMNIDAETNTLRHTSSSIIDMLAVANGKAFEFLPF
jgi:hypothetical protein